MAKDKPANKKPKMKKFSTFGLGREKEYIAENLSMLLDSGIGISASLEVVSSGLKSHQLRKILKYMQAQIDDGVPLWKCFESSGILPENLISLVKIGENSGKLPANLMIIAEQQKKDRSFKSKVVSALTYPMIVFGLTVFIGLGIAFFVLPKLSNVFDNMHVKLPWVTQVLINAGKLLGANIQNSLLVITVFSAVIFMILALPITRRWFRGVLFHLPKIKDMMKEIEIARFGYILGILLNSGLPIMEAMESLIDSTQANSYKKLYRKMSVSIEEGNSIEKSLANMKHSKKLIPIQIQQMVFAGERSGQLPEVLLRIDHIYEDKTDVSAKNLSTILEPILLFVVWFGVLFIALAVIMPIYGLIGGLN